MPNTESNFRTWLIFFIYFQFFIIVTFVVLLLILYIINIGSKWWYSLMLFSHGLPTPLMGVRDKFRERFGPSVLRLQAFNQVSRGRFLKAEGTSCFHQANQIQGIAKVFSRSKPFWDFIVGLYRALWFYAPGVGTFVILSGTEFSEFLGIPYFSFHFSDA